MSEDHPIRDSDEAILEDLQREQPDCIPFVANRLGMHLKYVDGRCELLVEYGLIEQVTGEPVYCLTDCGERYLAGGLLPDDPFPDDHEADGR